MNVQEIEVKPEEKQLQIEGPRIVSEAEAFKVIDDQTCEEAASKANQIKQKLDWATAFFKPMKDAAYAAHKAICGRETDVTKHFESAKKIYTQKAADWAWKKQREADEKEKKAKEEAARKEREKRAELEREAKKKAAEARQKAAEAAELRKAAKDLKKAGKTALAASKEAEANKLEEEARALDKNVEILKEQKEEVYIAPRPVAPVSKPSGISVQAVWVPEITEERKVPVEWRGEIDLGRLKRAKMANPKLEVPGIRFVQRAQGAALGVK